jgi:hypothetical protein
MNKRLIINTLDPNDDLVPPETDEPSIKNETNINAVSKLDSQLELIENINEYTITYTNKSVGGSIDGSIGDSSSSSNQICKFCTQVYNSGTPDNKKICDRCLAFRCEISNIGVPIYDELSDFTAKYWQTIDMTKQLKIYIMLSYPKDPNLAEQYYIIYFPWFTSMFPANCFDANGRMHIGHPLMSIFDNIGYKQIDVSNKQKYYTMRTTESIQLVPTDPKNFNTRWYP